MGENSAIEWTTHTFNPWIGCQAISPACDNCYAAAWVNGRLRGDFSQRRRTAPDNWRKPLRWDRLAKAAGVRHRVFCASMADVFDNQVPAEWRADLFDMIQHTEHLDWLLLTKRPQNIAKMIPQPATGWNNPGWPWPNVWLGTTVENQVEADRRIPHLLAVPARVRFLSCEPLLGPVDLSGWLPGDSGCVGCDDDHSGGWCRCSRTDIPRDEQCPENRAVFTAVEGPLRDGTPAWVDNRRETLAWVIAGGESGPKARPMHPDWARGLRDQCAAAGAAFFFKQWGNWSRTSDLGSIERADALHAMKADGTLRPCPDRRLAAGEVAMVRRSTKAGAELDGREHREVPHV